MSSFRATVLRLALAFGLSFAMWAFVSFSQNPEETVTFPDMSLETVGLSEGLVLVDSNGLPGPALPLVSVTLRTDRAQLASLRPVDIRVVADLTSLGAGEHIVPVNVQPTRSNVSFEIVAGGVEPSAVPIRLEQVSNEQVPVAVEIQGNLPFSFERGEPRVSFGGTPLETVQVLGPQSRVARVTAARANANIEQLRATYLAPLTLTPIDAAGQPVEGVRLDPSTVTVQIPINPVVGLKLVPVEPAIVGLPAPGYEVRGVLVEPPLIALAGSSGPLDEVDQLETEPIDLRGATETLVRSVAIIFPANTAPRPGEPDVARVTVQIAPLTLPFQALLPAQVNLTGVGPGLTATVSSPTVNVSVTGPSEALAALTQSPLQAGVEVGGLGPGSYTITATVNLPPGVSLTGDPPVLQVTLRPPPATPTPTTPPDDDDSREEPTPTGEAEPEPSATPTGEPGPTGTPEPAETATPEATATPGG